MYKRILVATDGSELSSKAVNSALDLAKMASAELVALNVIAPPTISYWDGTSRAQMHEVADADDTHTKTGQAIVHAVKEAGERQGINTLPITIKSDLLA